VELVISPVAARALRRIPAKVAASIIARMRTIAENPFGTHANVKRLTADERFRLRVGDWRVLYRVERQRVQVILLDVLKREEAYR
jgi:mRNA interferase RelE/StbE